MLLPVQYAWFRGRQIFDAFLARLDGDRQRAATTSDSFRYAGFWRRLGAYALDVLVLLPLILIQWVGTDRYLFFSLYALGPLALFSLFFGVYLVCRYGGTPGKLIMGLRIRHVDGSPIGYRAALVRFLPEFVIWLLAAIGLIVPLFNMTDPDFLKLGFLERNRILAELAPPWRRTVDVIGEVWVWSEFLVLLTNDKRRALHDFLAGTVVVIHEPRKPG
jgi:uncharacterized RDD family membrane protein YckC